jgi:nicotinamidase-related amidase
MAVIWELNQEIRQKMRILKEQTIGLIIDIQEKLFPHIFNAQELVENTTVLMEGMKVLNIPILVTEQYTKGLGFTIPSLSASLEGISIFEKISFSCCDDPGIFKEIMKMNKKNVIVAGIESHVCVMQTCIDLLEKGYQPVLIEDCVSSRKLKDKDTAIKRLIQEGVLISTYESILFELARYSGNDTFKAISKLVK